MSYEPKIVQRASARLARRRDIRERKRYMLEQQLYKQEPRLAQLDRALRGTMVELTDLIASCARDRAPFRLTHFAEELAGDFHSFYAACQVLPSEGRPVDPELSRARLAACDAVRVTLALVLTLVGVSAPEQM